MTALFIKKSRFDTEHPDVKIKRHEIHRNEPEGQSLSLKLAFNQYVYKGNDIEDSLGHTCGLPILIDGSFSESVDQALRDVHDEGVKESTVSQLLDLYYLRKPQIVLTDLLDDPNLLKIKGKKREQHLRIIVQEKGETSTLFHIDHDGYEGNPSYGKDSNIKPDTRGKLDWSGDLPYMSGLKSIKGEESSWTFDSYIGKTRLLNPQDPNSAVMLFAGFELDPPLAAVLKEYGHDTVLEQFSGKQSLKKLGSSLRPRLSVIRMDHPKL